MTNDPWVMSLKVGDEVCVQQANFVGGPYITKVLRVTPTGRVSVRSRGGGGLVEYNQDGRVRGFSTTPTRIRPITEADRVRQADQNARNNAMFTVRRHEDARWQDISTDQLTRIAAILNEPNEGAGC